MSTHISLVASVARLLSLQLVWNLTLYEFPVVVNKMLDAHRRTGYENGQVLQGPKV